MLLGGYIVELIWMMDHIELANLHSKNNKSLPCNYASFLGANYPVIKKMHMFQGQEPAVQIRIHAEKHTYTDCNKND